jgi:cell division transport system permease protein
MFHGVAGALIAMGMIIGLLYFLNAQIKEMIVFYDPKTLAIVGIGILALGILLTTISTFFAVNKYLDIKLDKLFY